MAFWYVVPEYAGLTPLMPSQQSSLRGTRTALACHEAIALIDVVSDGPSKIPQSCTHAYSVPDRLTPRRRTGALLNPRSWLPDTETVAQPASNATSPLIRATAPSARRRRDFWPLCPKLVITNPPGRSDPLSHRPSRN